MEVGITADFNHEANIREILNNYFPKFKKHFATKNYGDQPRKIFMVLMCRDPELNFKQRYRYDKSNNTLYIDVMAHLPDIIAASQTKKRELIYAQIISDVTKITAKYTKKLPNFNREEFLRDLQLFLESSEMNGPLS